MDIPLFSKTRKVRLYPLLFLTCLHEYIMQMSVSVKQDGLTDMKVQEVSILVNRITIPSYDCYFNE